VNFSALTTKGVEARKGSHRRWEGA
jgi:hypothetical protein